MYPGNDAYRVREHLTEAEMDTYWPPSRAIGMVTEIWLIGLVSAANGVI
jgi:hypothetical protein